MSQKAVDIGISRGQASFSHGSVSRKYKLVSDVKQTSVVGVTSGGSHSIILTSRQCATLK